jgi:tetratricopeptide (TPR) repeat protein
MLVECQRAIVFLEDYEAICKELDDREGEGQACAALASAYQTLQNDDKALTYLKTCLEMAAETENLMAEAEACCALGVIYNKRGDFEKSVFYFERNFDFARGLSAGDTGSNTALVDKARVFLGMAKGNQMLKRYVNVINHDQKSLLLWKAKRNMPGIP